MKEGATLLHVSFTFSKHLLYSNEVFHGNERLGDILTFASV